MSEAKQLKLHNFTTNSDREMTDALIKMVYHAAFTNRLGIADKDGSLYLVGVESKVDGEEQVYEFYPLAKILSTDEANKLTNE